MASNIKPKSYECGEDDDFQEFCDNFKFYDSVSEKIRNFNFSFQHWTICDFRTIVSSAMDFMDQISTNQSAVCAIHSCFSSRIKSKLKI